MLNKSILLVFLGYMLFTTYVQAYISIQVPNKLIDYGKTDIDIRCIVDGTSLESIVVIQLKRSDANIVLKSPNGVSWQDNQLRNRSILDASIKNVSSSYLHLKIKACDVNQQIDEETYQCTLVALGIENNVIQKDSGPVNLTITGFSGGRKEKCDGLPLPSIENNGKKSQTEDTSTLSVEVAVDYKENDMQRKDTSTLSVEMAVDYKENNLQRKGSCRWSEENTRTILRDFSEWINVEKGNSLPSKTCLEQYLRESSNLSCTLLQLRTKIMNEQNKRKKKHSYRLKKTYC